MPCGSVADVRLPAGRKVFRWMWPLCCCLVIAQTGCTALLSASAVRDAVRDSAESEAVVENDRGSVEDAAAIDAGAGHAADDESFADEPVLVAPGKSAEQALEDAIVRLTKAGRLDEGTQAALMGMLEQSPKQDWPEIIEAFVDSLETSHVAAKPVSTPAAPPSAPESGPATEPTPPQPAEPAPAPVAQATQVPIVAPVPQSPSVEPLIFPVDPPAEAATAAGKAEDAEGSAPTAVTVEYIEPESVRPELSVANACFAMRVRGWGLVDRFAASRFRPGQDVIVYFEMEHLEAREGADGHTTRIDTTLSLVADDGRVVHDWTFEPIEETCPARRRDYFARYVVRIPEAAPGGACRLELAVTDAIGERTAHTSLPLEIVK